MKRLLQQKLEKVPFQLVGAVKEAPGAGKYGTPAPHPRSVKPFVHDAFHSCGLAAGRAMQKRRREVSETNLTALAIDRGPKSKSGPIKGRLRVCWNFKGRLEMTAS